MPSVRRTALDPVGAVEPVDARAEAHVDAVVAVQLGASTMPISAPSARSSGTAAASSMVTSSPRPRHVAATSAPMKPAPTTTTRVGPRVEVAPQAEAVVERAQHVHAVEHRRCPGSQRAAAPVAMTSPSKPTRSPPSRRTKRSAQVEAHGPASEAPLDAEVLVGGRQGDAVDVPAPASTCFDSGGRS